MNEYEKLIDPGNEHTHDAKKEFEKEEQVNPKHNTTNGGNETR